MVKRNKNIAKLGSSYLFPEIISRKLKFLMENPSAKLISLGIGDTTEPLPPFIASELSSAAEALATVSGYKGYGPEEGYQELRELISQELYQGRFDADEIFVSDGANCDIGRIQVLFGGDVTMAVQDPSYPVYVDTSVILGQTDSFDSPTRRYHGITYMSCDPSNDFFPDLNDTKRTDLIYFCSPNNPTGAVSTHAQLKELVAFAKKNRSIIIFDTAYASYIQDPTLPRSIYEVEGAHEVAIELGSFSKMAGFTGVRLAWNVVPKTLYYDDGNSINKDWRRVHSTFFNGASNIAQKGGLAVLAPQGQREVKGLIDYYMENAAILREALRNLGYEVHGGTNAPYIWVRFPDYSSWDAFDLLLERSHLVSAPGSGFGPAGEGFIRISAFGKRSDIVEATQRLNSLMNPCSTLC